jgi:hypothetical protein
MHNELVCLLRGQTEPSDSCDYIKKLMPCSLVPGYEHAASIIRINMSDLRILVT